MIYPQAELYMPFHNPTGRRYGTRRSVQGFAVWGDWAFILYHTGICAVYDLATRDPAPLEVFRLASYNADETDPRFINHANDLVIVPGADGKPLMYITCGNSGELDGEGRYIAYCAVEAIDITEVDGKPHFATRPVQSIYFKPAGIERSGYQPIGWGWPASLVDLGRGEYVLFSARYRTTKDFVDRYNENNYIITRFALPEVKPGNEVVILTPADIVGQFTVPFDILITQGGMIAEGKLYYTFGFGRVGAPSALRVYDLATETVAARLDFSFTPFGALEIECCAFYGGKLLINTQSPKATNIGYLYAIDSADLCE